jgi:hypothetical protein
MFFIHRISFAASIAAFGHRARLRLSFAAAPDSTYRDTTT